MRNVSERGGAPTWTGVNYEFVSPQPPPVVTFSTISLTGLTLDGKPAGPRTTGYGADLYDQSTGHVLVKAKPFETSGKAFAFKRLASI